MAPPKEIKSPTLAGVGVKPGEEQTIRESRNFNALEWCIPADSRDGLKIHVGGKGHIIFTQARLFESASKIVLHSDEARALLKIPELLTAAQIARELDVVDRTLCRKLAASPIVPTGIVVMAGRRTPVWVRSRIAEITKLL